MVGLWPCDILPILIILSPQHTNEPQPPPPPQQQQQPQGLIVDLGGGGLVNYLHFLLSLPMKA